MRLPVQKHITILFFIVSPPKYLLNVFVIRADVQWCNLQNCLVCNYLQETQRSHEHDCTLSSTLITPTNRFNL